MTPELEILYRQRDDALRDLAELDQQVVDGEIPPEPAERLRHDYEIAAADALTALERVEHAGAAPSQHGPSAKAILYAAAAAIALIAVLIVLPRSIEDRPPGGTVSGNDVPQTKSQPAPGVPPAGSTIPRR